MERSYSLTFDGYYLGPWWIACQYLPWPIVSFARAGMDPSTILLPWRN